MTVLPMLCCRLNKYLEYLAISAEPVLKCGLVRSHMASWHFCHLGSSLFRIGKSAIGVSAVVARLRSHREVRATHHLLDGIIDLAANDGSLPQHRWVKGYLHPDLTHIQDVGLKGTVEIEGYRSVIAKADECIPEHSLEPRSVLARGTKTLVLTEGTMV
jgi:hypothetical protein